MSTEILLVGSWGKDAIQNELAFAKKLEEKGYTTHFFAPRSNTEICEALSGEFFSLADAVRSRLPTSKELERRYGIPSIRHLYFTEMNYFSLSRSQALDRTRRYAQALQKTLETTDIDYVVQGRGGEAHRLLAHYFAQEHGATSIWRDFSPFDDRVVYTTRLDGTWDTYETIQDHEIPTDEREDIDDYIESFRSEQQVYTYDTETNKTGSVIKDTVSAVLRDVRKYVTETTPTNPYNYVAQQLRKGTNSRINYRMLPSIQQSRGLCQGNSFVFFPLQYPIESRLTVFSPEFFQQSFLIEYLSRILSEGVKLFVKQHPNRPGQQSPIWIRRLEKNDQVTFLHPSFNAHEAIEYSDAVVVTNNTVGFETLFHNTPLVVLGHAFYEDVPAATKVGDLSNLPEAVAKAIDETISDTTVRSSVYSLQEATYSIPATLDDDQARLKMANALFSFINEYA